MNPQHTPKKRRRMTLQKINILLAAAVLVMAGLSYQSTHRDKPALSNTKSTKTPELTSPSQSTAPDPAEMKPINPPAPSVSPVPDQQAPTSVSKPLTAASFTSKTVYLTFDDGPSRYTDQIINILRNRKIHATFFVVGSQLKSYPKQVNHLIAAGNYVGFHSMSHSYSKLYKGGGPAPFIQEFKQEQALFKEMTGLDVDLIRAPYGSAPQIDKSFRDQIVEAGFKMWDWNVDSKDWSYAGKPAQIMKQVKKQVKGNLSVILMHETKQTVQALPQIIDYLKQKGYAFAVYKPEHHVVVNFAEDDRL